MYNVTGFFTNSNIAFDLSPQNKYETEDDITDFLDGSADFSHIYTCSKPIKAVKKQPEPFTTSSLQQTASNELHYAPKETMRICQALYEGGYITYMRTDSKKYSVEFVDKVKVYIKSKYGEQSISQGIDNLIVGSKKKEKQKNQELSKSRPRMLDENKSSPVKAAC